MKSLKYISLAATALLLAFTSCENEPVDPQDKIEKHWPATIITTEVGEFIKVQRSTFTMGSNDSIVIDEGPAHKVTFSKSYYIGKLEITQAQYKAIMGENPSDSQDDAKPVENISRTQALEFVEKLNTATGRNFSLPTEAQWEYAAKGGNQSQGFVFSGSNNIDDVAWYSANSNDATQIGGQKAANELGIFDMSGNVAEWCQDRYGKYTSADQTDPPGPTFGFTYVFRGGRFDLNDNDSRVVARQSTSSSSKYYNLGIRLVLDQPLDSELLP